MKYKLTASLSQVPEVPVTDDIQDPLRCNSTEPDNSLPAEGKPEYEMRLIKTIDASNKPIRSLIINK